MLIDDVKTEVATILAALQSAEAANPESAELATLHAALGHGLVVLTGHLGTTPEAVGVQPLDGTGGKPSQS